MGRPVTMFFTFWGLNVLRKTEKQNIKKPFIDTMFGKMMPRGVNKLKLSKMNIGGLGTAMMRKVMKDKNIDSLEGVLASVASVMGGVDAVCGKFEVKNKDFKSKIIAARIMDTSFNESDSDKLSFNKDIYLSTVKKIAQKRAEFSDYELKQKFALKATSYATDAVFAVQQ